MTTWTTHQILFIDNSEWDRNACPSAVVEQRVGSTVQARTRPSGALKSYDLDEEKSFLVSNDNWQQYFDKFRRVVAVALPEWLSPFEWIDRCVEYRYFLARGGSLDWPEPIVRAIVGMGPIRRMLRLP